MYVPSYFFPPLFPTDSTLAVVLERRWGDIRTTRHPWNTPANLPPASLLVYLFGLLFTSNFVLIFIITILLLAADFYYLKNIAGRRLVGLRWWNEVDVSTGDSQWVFESADPATKVVNATDSRFFWLAMYAQPLLWVALAILAVVRFEFIWLTLVGELSFLPFLLLVLE
jgi:hypothetical protein